jgi:hypothetical protein
MTKLFAFLVCLGLAGLSMPARAHDETAHRALPDNSIASSLPPELADPEGVRRALADRGIQFGLAGTPDPVGPQISPSERYRLERPRAVLDTHDR